MLYKSTFTQDQKLVALALLSIFLSLAQSLLLWLFDHLDGYALLMIDAETGKREQFPMPFNQIQFNHRGQFSQLT